MDNLTEAEKLLSGKYSLGIGVSVDIHSLLKTIAELRHEMNMQSSAMIELKQLREKCEGPITCPACASEFDGLTFLRTNEHMTKLNNERFEELTKLRARNELLTAALPKIVGYLGLWIHRHSIPDDLRREVQELKNDCEALAGEGAAE